MGVVTMAEINDEVDARPFDAALVRRLLALLRPQRRRMMAALAMACLAAMMELSAPVLLKVAVDHAILGSGGAAAQWRMLALICLAMGLVAVGQLLLSASTSWLMQRAGQEVLHDLRGNLLLRLLRLPMAGLLRQPVGRLLTRTVYDPATINEFVGTVVVQLTRDVLVIFGCVAVLWWLDWRILLVVLLALPLLLAASLLFRRFARANWRAVRAAVSRMTARLAETLSGLDDIQLARIEDRARRAYAVDNGDDFAANMRQMHVFAVFQPTFYLISVLAVVAALLAGAGAVAVGGASLGAVIAALGVVELMFRPVRDLAEKYNVLQAALASAERVAEVLDSSEEPDSGQHAVPSGEATIQFEGLWFAYEQAESGGEPPWVLRDFSATIGPGQCLALVGASGSGKSTVVALLLRLYHPQRGRITCNGVDIAQFNLNDWRRRLGLVLQEAALMAGSVGANCLAGADSDAFSRLAAAAAISGVDQLAGGGLERRLGEGGRGVSAGERQLISLTRALLNDPTLLLLDEATAHVDSQAEARIQCAIDALGERGCGLLIIAHRLATVRRADEIVVLDQGVVVERGCHHQLMAANGRFAELERLHRGEAWAGD